ncbi:hypothetical protein PGB90_003120 [Kerria lacca]
MGDSGLYTKESESTQHGPQKCKGPSANSGNKSSRVSGSVDLLPRVFSSSNSITEEEERKKYN